MGLPGTNYAILTDAAADVDLDVAAEGQVKIVPMSFSIGNQMKKFSGVLTPSEYMDFYYSQRQGDLTKTTNITVEDFENTFRSFAKQGMSILYIALSSGLSESYDSALTAKKTVIAEYPDIEIRVLDSFGATGGMGILVEKAIQNRDQGMSLEQNFNYLDSLHGHVHIWFYVQDLNYLRRGGRIGAATTIVGNMFNIKPVLRVDDMGKLVSYKNARGRENAQNTIFELFKTHYNNDDDPIYVIDADASSDADSINEMLTRFNPRGPIRRKTLSPIIGAHTGPGMVAICHTGSKFQGKGAKKK